MEFKRKKPEGTFYTDYFTDNGKMYLRFETTSDRVKDVYVCDTEYKTAKLRQTQFFVFIEPIADNTKQVFTPPRI